MSLLRHLKYEWLQVLILLVPFLAIPFLWNALPDRVPIHWDYRGHANGYGNKALNLILLPCVNVGVAALFYGLSRIDPKAWQLNVTTVALRPIRLTITIFLFCLYVVAILASMGTNVDVALAFQIGLPLFFLFLGNYLQTVKPNYFVGIRLPWTLESEDNWRKTHRFAGKLWMIASILYLIIEITLQFHIPEQAFLALLAAITIPPMVYSFVLFQKSKSTLRQ